MTEFKMIVCRKRFRILLTAPWETDYWYYWWYQYIVLVESITSPLTRLMHREMDVPYSTVKTSKYVVFSKHVDKSIIFSNYVDKSIFLFKHVNIPVISRCGSIRNNTAASYRQWDHMDRVWVCYPVCKISRVNLILQIKNSRGCGEGACKQVNVDECLEYHRTLFEFYLTHF